MAEYKGQLPSRREISWGEFFSKLIQSEPKIAKDTPAMFKALAVPGALIHKYSKDFVGMLKSQMYTKDKDPAQMLALAGYGLGMSTPGGPALGETAALGMIKKPRSMLDSMKKVPPIVKDGVYKGPGALPTGWVPKTKLGEGFIDVLPSRSVNKLVDKPLAIEARIKTPESMAKELGLTYQGKWDLGEMHAHGFRDEVTGGNLSVDSLDDLPKALSKLRKEFSKLSF